MPAYIRPIQHTRDFSLKPPDGLRYGNFDSIVHLPPINSGSQKIGPHSLSVLNNQQICRMVCEWFEIWRPWQQRTLLCGIVDRCSTRQLDILSTTFEPISHRDYETALHQAYPSAAFKKLKEGVKKQTKKQRGKKKAPPKIRNDPEFVETLSNEGDGSHIDAMTVYTADMTSRDVSPETVIFKVPTFIPEDSKENLDEVQPKIKLRKKSKADKAETETKTETLKGSNKDVASHLPKIGGREESLLKYNAKSGKIKKEKSKQVNKEDEDKQGLDRNLETSTGTQNVTGNFHGILKEILIEDSVETFANTLADNILDSAYDHLSNQKVENEGKEKHYHYDHVNEETNISPEIGMEEQLIDGHNENLHLFQAAEEEEEEYAESATEIQKDKTNQEHDLFHESNLQQTNLSLQGVKIKKTLPAALLSQLGRPSGEPFQKGQVKVTAPSWEHMSPVQQGMGEEKYESPNHDRNGSGLSKTLTEVNNVRYSLFGANAISTPDFFIRGHLYRFGPVQREVRRVGPPSRSLVPQNVPVAVCRFYKSVKWWPEEPHAGMIFLKPTKTELTDNFRDQILQIWNVSSHGHA
ncbi:hypothetical protein CHS0354_007651 [Potamilus streckersoni]|uniref:Uncharacterized protein n=1 Tax=Potamilus streckersoni TaxID=2493646 RepID=A0AAE0SHH3_9BIVA|nr:hypothetical protein CHS0354_007651 [Potamilus streckersoni]